MSCQGWRFHIGLQRCSNGSIGIVALALAATLVTVWLAVPGSAAEVGSRQSDRFEELRDAVRSDLPPEIRLVLTAIDAGKLDDAELLANQIAKPRWRTWSLGFVAEAEARDGDVHRAKTPATKPLKATHRDWILSFVALGAVQRSDNPSEALELVDSIGGDQQRIFVICAVAMAHVRLGDIDEAMRRVQRAEDELAYVLTPYDAAVASGRIAAVSEEAGDQYEATALKGELWKYGKPRVLLPIFLTEKNKLSSLVQKY